MVFDAPNLEEVGNEGGLEMYEKVWWGFSLSALHHHDPEVRGGIFPGFYYRETGQICGSPEKSVC